MILLTGGAGFIGVFTARLFQQAGRAVTVLDNLSTGDREQARWGAFHQGDIRNGDALTQLMRTAGVTTVVHLAAKAHVGESVAHPARYYSNNVAGTLSVLDAMAAAGVERLVFASSCSVYGNAGSDRIAEDNEALPVSPYGESKLVCERAMAWYERAYGIRSVSLRYFNVAGGDASDGLGEDPERATRIIPRAFHAAAGAGAAFRVFGSDFGTPDGTAVRDYVHVQDIARANRMAVDYLEAGGSSTIANLGTGAGVSVAQILEAVSSALGRRVPVVKESAQFGDPAIAVADARRARAVLGWTAEHSSLAEIVKSAVECYNLQSVRRSAANA